jgi:DNA primase
MNKQTILERLDFHTFYKGYIPSLTGDPQASGKCPFHDDQRASFSVNLDNGLWKCHAGCGSGNAIDLYMKVKGMDFKTALGELAREAGLTEPQGEKRITAVYDYTDKAGALLYQVVRYESKDFRPRRKGPDGSWIYDLQGVRRVPYNLPELMSASVAVIVEGEKDADNLKALGYAGTTAVTTICGGANAWREEYRQYFLSKAVAIVHDLDDPGRKFAETVAHSLHGTALSIRVITLPLKEGEGKDVSDSIALRRQEGKANKEIKAELTRLIKEALAWEPKAEDSAGIQQGETSGLVMLDTVTPAFVNWLWEGHIPLGKLTVIDGDPGLGKTL